MCGRTQGASTIQLYINDNAFMCAHLGGVPTFLAVILIINKKRRGRVKILTRPLLIWEMFCENILFILGYDYQSCISCGTQVLRRWRR